MQTKTLAIFALSASAVIASPFHKRMPEYQHRKFHGTGSRTRSVRPTGTGSPFPVGNDTDGFFGPTGTGVFTLPMESGSSVPTTFGNVVSDIDASSTLSCSTVSVVTSTSTNLITVTATPDAETKAVSLTVSSVSAGQFYGGQGSRSNNGGNWGQSTSAAGVSAPASSAPAKPSTTFATVPSASVPAGSASVSASVSASKSATTSAAASASAVAPSSGSSGGKRGISFNDAKLVAAFGSSVSWSYNWAATESGNLGGIEYVPMMWGRNDVSTFASKVGNAKHVLSFNEPDLGEQANIDASTAASLHRQAMTPLFGKVRIGSPAVTNGPTPMGTGWLTSFFEACGSGCPVDFVAYHWYAGADSIDYFIKHTEDVIATAKQYGISKVWLTEFQPTTGTPSEQAAFMKKAVDYLEGNAAVERYSAFMASEGTMLSGGALNTLGQAYASA
ncbi:hypothetical protein LTS08_003903 [Lithohypha guttulata]|nr:hypothetical protein LTS08_003903 [Lithohypha guttulata]